MDPKGERKAPAETVQPVLSYGLRIDFAELRLQKRTLIELQTSLEKSAKGSKKKKVQQQVDDLESIISLIDSIQDQAADDHKLPERDVFLFGDPE